VVNATTITATVPAGSAGSASVIVTTPSGSNAANSAYQYVAEPTTASVPTLGGWGMTVLALLLVSCAYLALRRRDLAARP
jgi:hypothetical protein